MATLPSRKSMGSSAALSSVPDEEDDDEEDGSDSSSSSSSSDKSFACSMRMYMAWQVLGQLCVIFILTRKGKKKRKKHKKGKKRKRKTGWVACSFGVCEVVES